MKKLILLSLILFGCTNEEFANEKIVAEQVATNLNIPWSINLYGDTFYISERVGTIAKITNDGQVAHEKVTLSDSLSRASEAGILGFVLKPNFEQSQEAFSYYTYDQNGSAFNRVVTIKYENGTWQETEIHLNNIPTGNIHHGGRLEIGPDNLLYVTIGDAGNPENAQAPVMNGKILRMQEDGSFEVYSTGHRNPQGLAWNEEGILYVTEHGQSANDEINIIEQGKNYGYPIIEGTQTKDGYVTPIITSGANETWAPSGITFHNGKLYVATLRGESIKVIDPSTNKVERSINGFGRVRDVHSDGDSLYFITNNTDGRGAPSVVDDVLYRLNE
jgi:YVTN family beta-propeller protein